MAHVCHELALRLASCPRGEGCRLERLFGLTSFGDIDEGEHRADQLVTAPHWVRPVLGRKARSVFVPHHFVVGVYTAAFSECLEYAAIGHRVRIAVGSRVMDEIVHVLAQQFVGVVEAEQSDARRVGERTAAVHVDPVDSLARRVQQ